MMNNLASRELRGSMNGRPRKSPPLHDISSSSGEESGRKGTC